MLNPHVWSVTSCAESYFRLTGLDGDIHHKQLRTVQRVFINRLISLRFGPEPLTEAAHLTIAELPRSGLRNGPPNSSANLACHSYA